MAKGKENIGVAANLHDVESQALLQPFGQENLRKRRSGKTPLVEIEVSEGELEDMLAKKPKRMEEEVLDKARVFRFENYWLHHSDFKQVVASAWSIPVGNLDSVKSLNAKFKILRRALKLWAKSLSCLKSTIAKLNELLFMWDFFEEFRELDTHEWSCRAILKEQLLILLRNQQIYWKQRGKIKGVKFGDENTKKIHTKASINYRHNHIVILHNEDQMEISDHAGKAAILLDAFKKRMGTSQETTMHFDLVSLYGQRQHSDIFANLELPFTAEEIEAVVHDLPNDKSPGPDGFNNEFLKSCWDIIKEDVLKFIYDFHAGHISLESLNTSFITLIPKGNSPLTANDFRPISLLNSCLKIVTKLLANRLQKEFEAIEDICIALRASDTLDCTDTWSYIWGTEQFSVAKAYKVLMGVKACWDLICPSRQANVSIMEAFLDLKQKLHININKKIAVGFLPTVYSQKKDGEEEGVWRCWALGLMRRGGDRRCVAGMLAEVSIGEDGDGV
ncbi:uncharacterized protein [Aegilops tauschii subsp. strangulata]|uniref:uncharacterized protein n=1 Tax=Aegilops tauschii subsp. strangulata TaxID=200361 RepID=UPI00098A1F54|nr:uncharacterized protein LOC109765257 [Aegilops tauschii subsp. strangulata]